MNRRCSRIANRLRSQIAVALVMAQIGEDLKFQVEKNAASHDGYKDDDGDK